MNYYTDVLKKYAIFSGRARRKEYWMFVLWNAVIGLILTFPIVLTKNTALAFVAIIYFLAVLVPYLALLARRIHDINLTAWWMLVGIIPSVGQIVIFVFSVIPGTPGDNNYGPDPKRVMVPQVQATSL